MSELGDHWLWRLTAAQWLAAASAELSAGRAALAQRRRAVTHARRAAGMALNGVLVGLACSGRWPRERCERAWGRSYLEHLRAVAAPEVELEGLDPAARAHAARLLAVAPTPDPAAPIALGRGAHAAARAALEAAAELLALCHRALATTVGGSSPPG